MWQLWHLILSSHLALEGRFHDPRFIGEDTQAQREGDTFPQGHRVSDKGGRAESESTSSVLGAPNAPSLGSSQRPGGPSDQPCEGGNGLTGALPSATLSGFDACQWACVLSSLPQCPFPAWQRCLCVYTPVRALPCVV